VETVLARGDYRVGQLLLKAFAKGEIFSAWDMDFHYSLWAKLIDNSYNETFLQELSPDEPLPWDFLQVNFKKDYMKEEYKKALSAVPTPSCDSRECKNCKGCIYGMKQEIPQILQREKPGLERADKKKTDITYHRVRIFYEKTSDFIFFSQLSMMKYIERLIRKSGIAFKCSEGFTPRMKITSLPPLPVFATGLNEVVELFLDDSFTENDILDLLNRSAVAEGFKFKKVIECKNARPLSRDIHFLGFEIIVEDLADTIDEIVPHLGETDFASYSNDRFILKMDYSKQGQERFARIYKIIDPEKKRTRYLTRTHVKFRG
jgi:radical SAM-linked protein